MNPLDLLNTPMQDVLDTKVDPYPAGDYKAQIETDEKAVDIATFTGKKESNLGKTYYRLDVKLNLIDPNLAAQRGAEKLPARYSIMLDVDDAGNLATGSQKNVKLGALKEAAGINRPGASLAELKGKVITVKLKHRPDEADPSVLYNDIVAVGRAS